MKFDLLIKNGRLIDGTGNPYYHSDIGIKGDRIIQIGRNIDPASAKGLIDAKHMIVSPGFIDAHAHDDLYVAVKPTADEKILQGVTCVINGNCGGSAGPIMNECNLDMKSSFHAMFGGGLLSSEFLNYNTFGEYLEKLEQQKPGINIASLVGHGTIRMNVMEMNNSSPDNKQLEKMKVLIRQAMKDGAFGLSSGLAYAPGSYADTAELIALCEVVSEQGGIYTTHMRNESYNVIDAISESIQIGEQAKVRVQISHHKAMGKDNWGKTTKTIELIEKAREKGIEITCDQYPYTAANTYLSAVLPPQYLSKGYDILSKKLSQTDFRENIRSIIENDKGCGWENFIRNAGFENLYISSSPNHPEYVSRSLAEIAEEMSISGYDLVFDLIREEKNETFIIMFVMNENDMKQVMQSPFTMIGSDGIYGFGKGKSHPRMTGTFPRILGKYVREEKSLTMEDAIRKMTSLTAQTFNIKGKGLLKAGYDADIVVFDPAKIMDRSTFEEPDNPPEGIQYVLVNGCIAVKQGQVTGATTGKVLRHSQ